ncbi:MAG: D-glycerate dehydrogenase [Planctomycetota bacterium]|nr:MAG: D-glycerate dehydrogenase [Planctomycetota bacterium]
MSHGPSPAPDAAPGSEPARPVVCTTRPLPGGPFAGPFARLAQEVDLRPGLEALAEAEGLVCFPGDPVDAALMARAPRLRAIATVSVGYDHIELPAAAARGIVVTHTPGVLTAATAELTFALMLAAARHLLAGDRLVREGGFRGFDPELLLGLELEGACLGVVGAGRIGSAVAERALAFGMRVLYHSRRPRPALEARGCARAPSLAALLEQADVVSLHVPLTAETYHLIGARELALMRPHAILVNTARGPVVDEAALVEALARGRPAAAALDVYEREPALSPGLAALPNAVLLPHLGSATARTRRRMAELAVAGLLDALAGRPPDHAVPLPDAPSAHPSS